MIRFHVSHNDGTTVTDWIEEPVKAGVGGHTAATEVTKLRQLYGDTAKIRIERKTAIPQPERKLFRFEIAVKSGSMIVKDADGEHQRDVSGLTLQSDVFQESETERVLAHLKETFPEARFTKKEVRSGTPPLV